MLGKDQSITNTLLKRKPIIYIISQTRNYIEMRLYNITLKGSSMDLDTSKATLYVYSTDKLLL